MSFFSSSSFDVFRFRDFAILSLNQLCLIFAILILEITIGYTLYQISKNPLTLGFIALAELCPFILLSFFGGYFADHFNKQTILKWGFSLCCPIPLLFIFLFWCRQQQYIDYSLFLAGIYVLIFFLGILRGIYSPSFNALRAFVVPEKYYSSANTWTAFFWQIGAIVAPMLAGLLLEVCGLYLTLLLSFALYFLGSIVLVFLQNRKFPSIPQQHVVQSLKEAWLFIFEKRIIFWSVLLDLSSVLFGGVLALLTIFAQDIFKTGAQGLGLLRAAPAIGTCLMMLYLIKHPPIFHIWRNMLLAIGGFSICTILFALSRQLWVSVLLLVLMGAFDSISMIIRQTLFQSIPPKNLLGRISALNGILVTSGNQLGALQSSLFTRWLGIIPATLISGCFCLGITLYSFSRTRDLFDYRLNKENQSFSKIRNPACQHNHTVK
ncbi:MFS transporter [Acinetobacter stercoris]|uniref:Enterobactin exporter EntS n=1 Tax=Acinetobacter stercoris TaxID=2126983 RepID=A0A2U3N3Y4_9GAMM|nr:MFS transporter [Acinetobacter stercoris]SPL72269.1 enterobactin exporter EntS [Acinetobacter stercoris]